MSDTRGPQQGKPILCLDFDGVIHSYTSGWEGASTVSDPPVPGAIEFIIDATYHFQVSIFSSRSHQSGGLGAMQGWMIGEMRKHMTQTRGGDPIQAAYDTKAIMSSIQWPHQKPAAFLTIDDRALTFTGTWPTMESLKAFRPWNKREPGFEVRTAPNGWPGIFIPGDEALGLAQRVRSTANDLSHGCFQNLAMQLLNEVAEKLETCRVKEKP